MISNQDGHEDGPIRINRRNYLSLFVGARDDNVGLGWPEGVKASRHDHAVMLSAAKHLDAQRDRPVRITHIVTHRVSGHRTPPPSVFRSLVAVPCINARVRCAGLAQVTMWVIHTDP